MNYSDIKQQVYDTTMKLVEAGLIRLSAGNISMRAPDGNVVITPSAVQYDVIKPEDMVVIDMNNMRLEGEHRPSSERALHTAIYKARPQVNAVVHTHPVYSIAFAVSNVEIPVINLEIFAIGGPIPVVPFSTPGLPGLGDAVADVLKARPNLMGALMQNHGMVTVGTDLRQAFTHAVDLETGAQIYHLALQTGAKPIVLTQEQLEETMRVYLNPKSAG